MSDFRSRLIEEEKQLSERSAKLHEFLDSSKVSTVDKKHLHLLKAQANVMRAYLCILQARLQLINAALDTGDGSNPPNGPGTPP